MKVYSTKKLNLPMMKTAEEFSPCLRKSQDHQTPNQIFTKTPAANSTQTETQSDLLSKTQFTMTPSSTTKHTPSRTETPSLPTPRMRSSWGLLATTSSAHPILCASQHAAKSRILAATGECFKKVVCYTKRPEMQDKILSLSCLKAMTSCIMRMLIIFCLMKAIKASMKMGQDISLTRRKRWDHRKGLESVFRRIDVT